jgi:hypothetical protein
VSNVIFYIINIHLITLGSLLGELVYYDFHLIYYTIETCIYKYLGGSVSFQCEILFFLFFIFFTNYTNIYSIITLLHVKKKRWWGYQSIYFSAISVKVYYEKSMLKVLTIFILVIITWNTHFLWSIPKSEIPVRNIYLQ